MESEVVHVVALISASGEYGGPASVALDQVEALNALRKVTTLYAGWDGVAQTLGDPAHVQLHRARRVLRKRIASLYSFRLLWSLAHMPKPAVAHIHFCRDLITLPAAAVALLRGIPIVLQPHGMVRPDPRRIVRIVDALLTRPLLRHAASVIVLTQKESTDVEKVARRPVRTVALNNGIAIDTPEPPVHRLADRDEPLQISFVGRLHPRKQVMVFAEAAAALLNEDLNLHFTAAGPDAGDLAEFRRFLASHANVASRMEYAGALSRDAARNLLKATDIYVLPSIGEVYPVTALEAMAAGAALVITSDCPLSQELAASGCAVVTDPNVLDVSAGVRRLIADPALREAISNRAFKEVSSRYAISAVAQRLIRIYDDAEDRSSQEDDG